MFARCVENDRAFKINLFLLSLLLLFLRTLQYVAKKTLHSHCGITQKRKKKSFHFSKNPSQSPNPTLQKKNMKCDRYGNCSPSY